MNNEERNEIIKKYNHLLKIKEEIIKQKQEIEELEQNPIIRRYLELKERLETDKDYGYYEVVDLDNDKILEKAIQSVRIDNTNSIFVYSGTYLFEHEDEYSPSELIMPFDDPNADYSEYKNIELDDNEVEQIKLVPPVEREKFEKNNIVLYPPKGVNSAKYYSEIKTMYFDTAVKYGCEKALEKVLYRRNMQKRFKR